MLYVVATPIGNLDDISFRAITTLQSVDVIAAEDTRHTKQLLTHYNIHTPLISLHEHNEQQQSQLLVEKLQAGQSIALVSDAGTPLISDPGHVLVNGVWQAGFRVVTVPGASAVIAALSVAGIAVQPFTFYGFLPAKQRLRAEMLMQAKNSPTTTVFYESPHRILEALQSIEQVYSPNKNMAIAKELTKKYENILHGSVTELIDMLQREPTLQKGEFVLILPRESARQQDKNANIDNYLELFLPDLPLKQAVKYAAALSGANKNSVYERALKMRDGE